MPKTREEIEAMKAAATGQPPPTSSGIATQDGAPPAPMPTGDRLLAAHPEFQAYIGEALERDAVIAALANPAWGNAIQQGGLEAIAGALYLCKENRLLPHRGHVYVMQIDRRWVPMISAYGYAAIATRLTDLNGRTLFRGLEWDDPKEIERDGKPYVTVKCRVKRADGGSFEGIGRKPRNHTSGSKVGKFDDHAEGKAETMAARRAFQLAFPTGMPLDAPPGFTAKDYDDAIDGEEVPPTAIPATTPPVVEAPPSERAAAPYAGERADLPPVEDLPPLADSGEEGGTDGGSSREGAGAEPAAASPEPAQPTLVEGATEEPFLDPDAEAIERANTVQRLHDAMEKALAGREGRDAFLLDMIEKAGITLGEGETVTDGLRQAMTEQIAGWAQALETALTKRAERAR